MLNSSQNNMENLWIIMRNNQFHIDSETNTDYFCIICNNLMINASNGPCGCRYCFDCISSYLEDKNQYCPGKSSYCKDEILNLNINIQSDRAMNRRISMLVVKCPENNCNYRNELRYINNHMTTCKPVSMNCIYFDMGCKNSDVAIEFMKQHLLSDIVSHSKLLSESIGTLKNEMKLIQNTFNNFQQEICMLTINVEKLAIFKNQFETRETDIQFKIDDLGNKISIFNDLKTICEANNDSMSKNVKNLVTQMMKYEKIITKIENDNKQLQQEIKNLKLEINNIKPRFNFGQSSKSKDVEITQVPISRFCRARSGIFLHQTEAESSKEMDSDDVDELSLNVDLTRSPSFNANLPIFSNHRKTKLEKQKKDRWK